MRKIKYLYVLIFSLSSLSCITKRVEQSNYLESFYETFAKKIAESGEVIISTHRDKIDFEIMSNHLFEKINLSKKEYRKLKNESKDTVYKYDRKYLSKFTWADSSQIDSILYGNKPKGQSSLIGYTGNQKVTYLSKPYFYNDTTNVLIKKSFYIPNKTSGVIYYVYKLENNRWVKIFDILPEEWLGYHIPPPTLD